MRATTASRRVPGLIALVLIATAAAAPAVAARAAGNARTSVGPVQPGKVVAGTVLDGTVLAGTGVLDDVAATSASNAWAVGHYGDICNGPPRTLIEHWNGEAWRRVQVRPVRGWLDGVAATSAHDVWVTGSAGNGGALILHFNGRTWRRYSPGGAVVADVTAISARNAWAVGIAGQGSLILHWNGKTWRRVHSPSPAGDPFLVGVSALSAKNIWAVGGFGRTITLHWNGSVWRRVTSPSPAGGSALQSVAAITRHNVWAVGESAQGTLVLHWNGTHWRKVTSPPVAKGAGLLGVSGTSAHAVWAVGTTGGLVATCSAHSVSPRPVSFGAGGPMSGIASDARAATAKPEPVIMRWNGTSWRRVRAPRPANGGQLIGVFTGSGGIGLAVGCTRTFGNPKASPLVVRLHVP